MWICEYMKRTLDPLEMELRWLWVIQDGWCKPNLGPIEDQYVSLSLKYLLNSESRISYLDPFLLFPTTHSTFRLECLTDIANATGTQMNSLFLAKTLLLISPLCSSYLSQDIYSHSLSFLSHLTDYASPNTQLHRPVYPKLIATALFQSENILQQQSRAGPGRAERRHTQCDKLGGNLRRLF